MKTGRSLEDIVTELARQRATKRDFLADTRSVSVDAIPGKDNTPGKIVTRLVGAGGKQEQFGVQLHALRQMEGHLGIPAAFADRLQTEHPDLLAHNLNQLLHRNPSTQMIRTLDGDMRAFLSNKFRTLDNFQYAEAVMQAVAPLMEVGKIEVESCEVTSSRLYIKVVRNDLRARIGFQEGWQMGKDHNFFDEVVAAAVFSNSEVGAGSLWFRPGVWTKRCTNLAVFENNAVKKVHLGRSGSAGEDGFFEMLSDKTKELTDAVVWAQVRDLATAALDGRMFNAEVAKLQGATQDTIKRDITETIELAAEKFQFNETERKGILDHLIRGGQMTRYGLHSAVTRFSQEVESYDRASELERVGGRIIELAPTEWQKIAA